MKFKTGAGLSSVPSKRLPTESSGFCLPQATHDYLASGAPEGARNDAVVEAAMQFRDCRLSESECLSRILPIAIAQGGPTVQYEVEKAVKSAYSKPPRDPILPLPDDGRRVTATPALSGWAATMKGLSAAFEPNDLVGINPVKVGGCKATVHKLKSWENRPNVIEKGELGAYVCMNPLKSDEVGATIENVKEYRHCLIEFDSPDMSQAQQEAAIRKAGFPVSLMVTSGKRSVHAWVRVDAPDIKEWERRRQIAMDAAPGCDPKAGGVARMSRLPGFMRGDKEQKLLAVKFGAKSWTAFEKGEDAPEPQTAESWVPQSYGVCELVDDGPEAPPEIIKGVLRKGCVMQISSGPKMKKSYTLLDLAISVERGIPWMGLETVAGPVFIADAENQAALIRQRLPHVMRGRGVKPVPEMNKRFRIAPMRGALRGKTLAQIVAGVVRSIREMPEPPVLAILEPLYLLLRGAKEKEAEEVTAALEELDEVCREVGCSVVFVHHFSKGGQGGKASMDRASGSGALSRFPDVIFTLNPPDEPKKGEPKADYDAMVSMDLRWFAKQPDFPVYWRDSHYTQDKSERAVGYVARVDRWEAVRGMPVKHRGSNPQNCEVAEWIARFCGTNLLEAFNSFVTLSADGLGFVKDLGDGYFEGANNSTSPPVESEVDDNQPF